MAARRTRVTETPAQQVAGFIAKFDPDVARLARGARRALRKRFPTAVELVYDSYNALAIGWGPNERTWDAIVSLAIVPRGVNLYFLYGATLPDPKGLLLGAGNRGRFLRLQSVKQLEEPGVRALLRAAEKAVKTPFPASGRGYTVVKSVSKRQRPRRPA